MAKRTTRGIANYFKQNNEEYASDGANTSSSNVLDNIPSSINNQEVLLALQKISRQLEKMQAKQPKNEQSGANQIAEAVSSIQPSYDSVPKLQTEKMVSQELQNIFSTLLQSNSNETGKTEKVSSNNKQSQNNPPEITAVQDAAQMLSQAQYELSNELEASLKKLKEVISESEKIANKISNLIGEEDTSKKS